MLSLSSRTCNCFKQPSITHQQSLQTQPSRKLIRFSSVFSVGIKMERRRAPKRKAMEIEAVLDMSVSGLQTYFLIKWKGYNNNFNEWVNERQLDDSQGKIMFFKTLPKKIINFYTYHGQLYFTAMTNGGHIIHMERQTANETCPILVLQFYETRLKWMSNEHPIVLLQQSNMVYCRMGNRQYPLGAPIGKMYGCIKTSWGFFFLIEWADIPQIYLVPTQYFYQNYTKAAIAFYESKLIPAI